jgi:S1-C subfamily serine protease
MRQVTAVAATVALATGCAARAPVADRQPATGLEQQYEQVVKGVLPSVVQINTDSGLGSGVVYDTKGHIVTNDHVVVGAHRLQVIPATGKKTLPARLVGHFAPSDLAVLKVDDGSLRPARFGDSSKLTVGRLVLAMGNPLGLSGSVTNGIVSALGRTVSSPREGRFQGGTIADAVQTSAPINPGNSGGALVTLNGDVVGVPALAASDPTIGGAAAGIGFAIPSNTVKSIADQLIASGKVTHSGRAAIGVRVRNVLDIRGNVVGVGVVDVTRDGPGQRAGIARDDLILSVNGAPTPTTTGLTETLATLKPGQRVKVEVQHPDGRKATVEVTLGNLPG